MEDNYLEYQSTFEVLCAINDKIEGGVTPTPGGGIPEAPKDGNVYGRKDGTWAKVEGGAGKEVIYLDNDMDMTELYDKCANAVEAAGGDIKAIYNVLAGYEIYATLEGGLETLSDARWMTVYNGTTGLRMTFVDIEGRLGIWDIGDNKIVQLIGAPAMVNDGGGIPEAPKDGNVYGRKDGTWAKVEGGSGDGKETILIEDKRDGSYVDIYNALKAVFNEGGIDAVMRKYDFYTLTDNGGGTLYDIHFLDDRIDIFINAYLNNGDNTGVVQFMLQSNGDCLNVTQKWFIGEAPEDGKTYGRNNKEWVEITGGGSSKEIIYLNGKSQEEYVELFNRLRPEMLAGNFHNFEFYWQITGESSVDRAILMDNVDVSQENWLVFSGQKIAFANPRVTVQVAIQNDGVCYTDETSLVDDAPYDENTYGRNANQWAPVVTVMQLTQPAYDAIEVKNPNTLYIIIDN